MARVGLNQVLRKYFEDQVEKYGPQGVAKRLRCTVGNVHHLRAARGGRGVNWRHIDKLAVEEGKSLADVLKELAITAAAMEIIGAVDQAERPSASVVSKRGH